MRRLGPFVALHLACVSLFCLLVWQLAQRVAFPWDLIVWSESPFMTNMLKLQAGEPLYGPPSEASSFVYGPALDYLTYGLLRPFGMALDIRACRVINVLVGMAAAAAAAASIGRVAPRLGRVMRAMLFVLFTLVIFKSFTADVPHPDNLHLLHLTLTFYLGLRAVERGSFGWALGAVALGGLGMLVKQPAALAAVGVLFAFALSERWSGSRLLVLAGVAALSTGLSAALLLVPEHSRFWTFELLLRHPIEEKLQALFSDVHFAPHRVLLWALGIWGLARWWRTGERAALTLLVALGMTAAGPSLAAYFKVMGAWNNLTVVDVWFALCAAPHLCRAFGETTRFEGAPSGSRAADALVGALLLVTLVPTRMAPTRDHYRYARELEALVHADLAAGRRVLVAHGAMFHIRAGHREPLLDRANSILELAYGGFAEAAHTRARLERHYYDRVYVNSFWYDPSVAQTLSRAYRSDRGIAGVTPPFTEYRWGWQHLTSHVGVLSPRTGRASDPRARRTR